MTEAEMKAESESLEIKLFPWWLLLLWGLLTIVIGLMFLLTPVITMELFVTFLGAYWLVGGLFMVGGLFVDRTHKGMKVLLAGINIIAGALILMYFLMYPLFSTIFIFSFLILFLAFWAIFIGAVHIYHAYTAKDLGNGVLGIISIVFGILLLAHPFVALVLLPFVAGGFCLVSGLTTLYISYGAKGDGAAPGA